MNRHQFVFTFTALSMAAVVYWTLVSNPPVRPNVPAFSEAEYQRPLIAPPQQHRDIDTVLNAGLNPFALPPDVSSAKVVTVADNGGEKPDNGDTPKPELPHGDVPPPPPNPDHGDTPPATDTTGNTMLPPPKYKWPVGFLGVSILGNKRFVHVTTDDGASVMASEGDTLAVVNEKGEPEKVTIIEITNDRIRVRNEKGLETDLDFDRLRFHGKVFPDEEANPFDVTEEDLVKEKPVQRINSRNDKSPKH